MGRRQRSCYGWLHLIRQKLEDRGLHWKMPSSFQADALLMLGHKIAPCPVEKAPLLSDWERWKNVSLQTHDGGMRFKVVPFLGRSQEEKNSQIASACRRTNCNCSIARLFLKRRSSLEQRKVAPFVKQWRDRQRKFLAASAIGKRFRSMDCRMSMLNSWQATRSLNYALRTPSTDLQ